MPDHYAEMPPCDTFSDAIVRRVGIRLAMRRRDLGIDARLLDTILALREGTVERMESGRRRIAPSHLFRLACLFGVSVDWFFSEPGPADVARVPARDEADPARHASGSGASRSGPGQGDLEEARRFLAAYLRLRNTVVRKEIRELVNTLAWTPGD